jgi:hypothetical protein
VSRWVRFLLGSLVFVVALAVVFALSVAVGYYGSPDTSFDWALASVFGTAAGTTLLALATSGLAWSTRSEMRATQDLAELTRRGQVNSERPTVLLESLGWGGDPGNGVLYVRLRNVGLGPALRLEASAHYEGHVDWVPAIDTAHALVIAPGEPVEIGVHVSFPEPHDRPGGVVTDGFLVVGTYSDRSMQNRYPIITTKS